MWYLNSVDNCLLNHPIKQNAENGSNNSPARLTRKKTSFFTSNKCLHFHWLRQSKKNYIFSQSTSRLDPLPYNPEF